MVTTVSSRSEEVAAQASAVSLKQRPVPTWVPLGAIVLVASLLASIWVFLVPMFEGVDENQHLAYAVAIYAAGRPIAPGTTPSQLGLLRSSRPLPDLQYLEKVSGFENVQDNPRIKAPAGYGTAAYYQSVDRGSRPAPLTSALLNPPLLRLHSTFGYYALAAMVLWVASLITSSPVAMFFAVRLLSVVLLAIGLVFTYLVARELGIGRRPALFLTGVIGLFPSTTYVSSYTQPDSAAFALIPIAMYAGLRWRCTPNGFVWPAILGCSLGVLGTVKVYYLACVGLALVAMLASEWLNRGWTASGLHRAGAMFLLSAPSIALLSYQKALFAGSTPVRPPDPTEFRSAAAFHGAVTGGPLSLGHFILSQIGPAYNDVFGLAPSSIGFWGNFGWNDAPLSFGPLELTLAIALTLLVFTAVVVGCSVYRLGSTFLRLVRVARRGRWRTAITLAFRNPVLNAFYIFTGAIFLLDVENSATIHPSGRYWIPLLLGLLLNAFYFAPRALPRRWRRAAGGTFLVGFSVYTLVAAAVALPSLYTRYYGAGRALRPVVVSALQPVPEPGLYKIQTFVGPGQLLLDPPRPAGYSQMPHVPRGKTIGIAGWAIDPSTRTPATTVFITIDAKPTVEAVYGDASPDASSLFGSPRYSNCGFDAIIDTSSLQLGVHTVGIAVVGDSGNVVFAPAQTRRFLIT